MSKKNVPIRIQDQEFLLSTDASPERVAQLAELLNGCLGEIQSKSKALSPYRAVILAALQISERYLELRDEHYSFRKKVALKSSRILSLLDQPDPQASAGS
jgi:cell division protein ZapA (FtsZ GTPase activity inhibitor)